MYDSVMTDFSETVIKLRKKIGLIQDDMADKLGMNRANYIGVEKGRRFMTEDQLKKLSELTGEDYQSLYEDHERWELKKKPHVAQKIVDKAKFLPTESQLALAKELFANAAPDDLEFLKKEILEKLQK